MDDELQRLTPTPRRPGPWYGDPSWNPDAVVSWSAAAWAQRYGFRVQLVDEFPIDQIAIVDNLSGQATVVRLTTDDQPPVEPGRPDEDDAQLPIPPIADPRGRDGPQRIRPLTDPRQTDSIDRPDPRQRKTPRDGRRRKQRPL